MTHRCFGTKCKLLHTVPHCNATCNVYFLTIKQFFANTYPQVWNRPSVGACLCFEDSIYHIVHF